ncbi:MAG TPA: GIY-YIG nuclease family protein [Methanoregulaceae archaeon]|nr:GIY-YIG nuclease family protein [Methanoregulaceae archaeon]
MNRGIYCLILENASCTLTVGALGPVSFRQGWHVYVGSAGGPGGLLRVARHIRYSGIAAHSPRWHIDYLLSNSHFHLVSAVCAYSGSDMECRLAESIRAPSIFHFGSSDCSCPSHLFYYEDFPEEKIIEAYEKMGLFVIIQNIKKV